MKIIKVGYNRTATRSLLFTLAAIAALTMLFVVVYNENSNAASHSCRIYAYVPKTMRVEFSCDGSACITANCDVYVFHSDGSCTVIDHETMCDCSPTIEQDVVAIILCESVTAP